jgi:hypothetical protein
MPSFFNASTMRVCSSPSFLSKKASRGQHLAPLPALGLRHQIAREVDRNPLRARRIGRLSSSRCPDDRRSVVVVRRLPRIVA